MKPALQLRLAQQLTLTPQLQQSIRLLQLSTVELVEEIAQAVAQNPLLEAIEPLNSGQGEAPLNEFASSAENGQENSASQAAEESNSEMSSELGDWGSGYRGHMDDDENEEGRQPVVPIRLQDHLVWQVQLSHLSEREQALVGWLIESLDEAGYLPVPLSDFVDMGADEEELRIALCYLQSLEPLGVGARDVRECLLLQLNAQPLTPAVELARLMVSEHLALLANRDFSKLKRLLKCEDDALRAAHLCIMQLNPRPAADFAAPNTEYVVPDVMVRKMRGQWVARLNQEVIPKFRLNRLYTDLVQRQREGNALAGQLQEAKWLIKNVQQRFETILRVAQAIVDEQQGFLEQGEIAMRPLVLREIADTLGLHESTVSRVTTRKYIHTPRGVFELKYFFGSHVETHDGGACSSTAIRALIRQFIQAEDKRKPLSDSALATLLEQQGVQVARRTVAKYREAMQIPAVNLRKSI